MQNLVTKLYFTIFISALGLNVVFCQTVKFQIRDSENSRILNPKNFEINYHHPGENTIKIKNSEVLPNSIFEIEADYQEIIIEINNNNFRDTTIRFSEKQLITIENKPDSIIALSIAYIPNVKIKLVEESKRKSLYESTMDLNKLVNNDTVTRIDSRSLGFGDTVEINVNLYGYLSKSQNIALDSDKDIKLQTIYLEPERIEFEGEVRDEYGNPIYPVKFIPVNLTQDELKKVNKDIKSSRDSDENGFTFELKRKSFKDDTDSLRLVFKYADYLDRDTLLILKSTEFQKPFILYEPIDNINIVRVTKNKTKKVKKKKNKNHHILKKQNKYQISWSGGNLDQDFNFLIRKEETDSIVKKGIKKKDFEIDPKTRRRSYTVHMNHGWKRHKNEKDYQLNNEQYFFIIGQSHLEKDVGSMLQYKVKRQNTLTIIGVAAVGILLGILIAEICSSDPEPEESKGIGPPPSPE